MSPASFATHRGTCNSMLVACTRAAHFQTGEYALQVAKKKIKFTAPCKWSAQESRTPKDKRDQECRRKNTYTREILISSFLIKNNVNTKQKNAPHTSQIKVLKKCLILFFRKRKVEKQDKATRTCHSKRSFYGSESTFYSRRVIFI